MEMSCFDERRCRDVVALQSFNRFVLFLFRVFFSLQAVPQGKVRCWERAAKGSFFSRENACNFIGFCRQLGIHENLLFESEDLGKRVDSSLFIKHSSLSGRFFLLGRGFKRFQTGRDKRHDKMGIRFVIVTLGLLRSLRDR